MLLVIFLFSIIPIIAYFGGTWQFAKLLYPINFKTKYFGFQIIFLSLISLGIFLHIKNDEQELKTKYYLEMERLIGLKINPNSEILKYKYHKDFWQNYEIEFQIELNLKEFQDLENKIKNKQFNGTLNYNWTEKISDYYFNSIGSSGEFSSAILNKETKILTFSLSKINL